MTFAVTFLFAIWFLIWFLYIFKPHWLGRLRYPLHVTGWVNNWSMFVAKETAALKGTYMIFYKDFDQDHAVSEWTAMPKVSWEATSFIFGIGVRRETLLRKFVKEILKKHLKDINTIPSPNVYFDFLCEVILKHNTAATTKFRQVKIEYYSSRKQETIEIVSEILPRI